MEKKRKFLFVSLTGFVGDIAWQVLKEGHEVRYYIDDEKERDIADGFVPKIEDWEKDVEWADIIVFDDTLGQGEQGASAARARQGRRGRHAVHRPSRRRSLVRPGRTEEGRRHHHSLPGFRHLRSRHRIRQENPDPLRHQAQGEAGNVKRRLFVGEEEDGQDVIGMLEAYKKAFSDEIKVFQLQRRVIGVEVAVGGFFNGKKFVTPSTSTSSTRNSSPATVGPPTGEMGTAMFWSEPNATLQSDAAEDGAEARRGGLRRLHRRQLHRQQQRHLPLEFTSRFGYPTIFIQQEGMITPIGLFFWDLANGHDPK